MYRWARLQAMFTLALLGGILVPTTLARQDAAKDNWMAEYVQFRVSARTLRGARAALLEGTSQLSLAQPRIVGGTPATANDNPFQVGLLMKSQTDNFKAQFCGGTLIADTVVVTAAHCSDFVTSATVQVLSGTRKLDGSGTRHNVSSIAIHPNWDANTFDNDVAVWRLATAVKGGTFATLATADAATGVQLLATGWGQLTQGGKRPVDLMKVQVPVADLANCNDKNSYNGEITAHMFCAGLEKGGKDTCQGDSGGPLTGGGKNMVLTGITSWGNGCAQPNFFGVYTKVSHTAIRQFIEKHAK
jgi:secreted trypsin-like serine protease